MKQLLPKNLFSWQALRNENLGDGCLFWRVCSTNLKDLMITKKHLDLNLPIFCGKVKLNHLY